MALIKCKECGNKISTKATACPSCGAVAAKRTSAVTWLVAIMIVPIVAISIFSNKTPAPDQPAKPAPTAEQQAAADKSSMEYATVMLVKKAVQASLRDPNPDHVKFTAVGYREPGYVCGYVNSRNAYGGMTGDQMFMVEVSTSKLKMEDGTNTFAKAWNKICVD